MALIKITAEVHVYDHGFRTFISHKTPQYSSNLCLVPNGEWQKCVSACRRSGSIGNFYSKTSGGTPLFLWTMKSVGHVLKRNKLALIGAILGAIAGYIYWYYWGCTEGCTIRSVWWRMSIWGAFTGGLLLSMFESRKA